MGDSRNAPAPAQIQRFAVALLQAVHDAKHESENKIQLVHYWDSDSLVVPIRGFKAFETQNDNSAPENALIQSLLAAGLLGQVRLTAAHRSELLALVDGWSSEKDDSEDRFHDEANRFLRSQEISVQPWARLPASPDDAERSARELKELTSRSGPYFALLESVAGNWRTRWNRLVEVRKIIDLRASEAALSDLMVDARFNSFAQSIAAARHRPRPLATAIDAAALVEIARLTDAAREGATVYPRFFSSSPSLRRAFRESSQIRSGLSFSYQTYLSSRVETIWREADYYFLRASIPSLMRPGVAIHDGGPSLVELESLANAMASLLDSGKLDSVSMRSIQKDAEPLIEAIRRFESMGMEHIWLSVDFREVASHLSDGLSQIQDRSAETRLQTSRSLLLLSQEVAGEAQDFGLALGMAGAIQDAGSAVVALRQDHCMSLSSDLGSVRWDVLPGAEKDQICFGDRVLDGALASHLFTIDAIKSGVDEAERACALLLAFDRFELVSKVINALAPTTDSDRLHIMSQVARIHFNPTLSIATEFHYLVSAFNGLSQSRQDALALGYGFAAFSLWDKATGGSLIAKPSSRNEGSLRETAQWAFAEVQKRVGGFEGLTRAFALNHLIYVATCCGISHADLPAWVMEFDPLARRSDNHRFLDTLAWRILLMNRASAGPEGVTMATQDAVRLLTRAASLAPFDDTVASHLHIAHEIQERARRNTQHYKS